MIEIIKTRRSIRNYKEEAVSDEIIQFLIECAKYAPSGFNIQPWGFLVIKNKDLLHKLSESGKKAMIPILESTKNLSKKGSDFLAFLKTKESNMLYDAPVLIIVLGNKNSPVVDFDCAMAAQNMMLAAHSKGIGSCWIGGLLPALMDEKLLEELGVQNEYKAVAPLIFGYPEGKTKMPEKNEPEVKWLM